MLLHYGGSNGMFCPYRGVGGDCVDGGFECAHRKWGPGDAVVAACDAADCGAGVVDER